MNQLKWRTIKIIHTKWMKTYLNECWKPFVPNFSSHHNYQQKLWISLLLNSHLFSKINSCSYYLSWTIDLWRNALIFGNNCKEWDHSGKGNILKKSWLKVQAKYLLIFESFVDYFWFFMEMFWNLQFYTITLFTC